MFTDNELTATPETISYGEIGYSKPDAIICMYDLPFPYKVVKPVLYSEMIPGEAYLVRSHMIFLVIRKMSGDMLWGQTKTIDTPHGHKESVWSNECSWHFENNRPLLLSMDYDAIPSMNLGKLLLYGALGLASIIGMSAGFNMLNKSN